MPALRLVGASKAAVDEEVVAFNKEEFSTLSGQRRAPIIVGAVPVLVEGPTDAIAATLASHGHYLGSLRWAHR